MKLARGRTEIPTIIGPSATIKYPSATGPIIVGISVRPLGGFLRLDSREKCNQVPSNIETIIYIYTWQEDVLL